MDGPTKIVTNKKGKIEKPSREYFAVLQVNAYAEKSLTIEKSEWLILCEN